ncbi:MAG: hypothetical protein V1838_00440, partial [Patescibacteria group bacterium]
MSGKHKNNVNNKDRGSILLISLLIIATITAIILGMSIITINGLRSASLVDRSVEATYAAESGLEWALEKVGEDRATAGISLTDVVTDLTNASLGKGTLINNARWSTLNSSAVQDELIQDIAQDEFVELDLYDPNNP